MRRSMILVTAVLVATACTDRPAPLAPTVPRVPITAASQAGAPEPIDVSFVLDACGFDVLVEITGKEKFIEHPNGRLVITAPGESVTMTNLANDKQATEDITGTIRVAVLENGDAELNLTGRSFFERENGLVITVGNWNTTIDLGGNEVVPLHGTGRLIDACALLS